MILEHLLNTQTTQMDDKYKHMDEYKPNKKREIWIFDDMITRYAQ